MNLTPVIDLIHNLALLVSTAVLFDLVTTRWNILSPLYRKVLSGIAAGIIGIIAMLIPWVFSPGILFDMRSVLLGISGLFLGWFPTMIAMAMTAGFRIVQGGGWTVDRNRHHCLFRIGGYFLAASSPPPPAGPRLEPAVFFRPGHSSGCSGPLVYTAG